MAVPVEEAVAALATFSLEDDQPDIQGLAVTLIGGRSTTESAIDYEDVPAYQLSLAEDTVAITQLDTLVMEGRDLVAVLYSYRSCVKALPQLPESMKHSQGDLYLETYQVLDVEIGRLRGMQRWQAAASTKLASDMHKFSRSDKKVKGPTVTHMWYCTVVHLQTELSLCMSKKLMNKSSLPLATWTYYDNNLGMLKLLDVLLQLDHLKNAKASIPNDFSWYKRTFTQVSTQWPDTDGMREELDDLQIFLSTRWTILLNLQAEVFRVNGVEDVLQVLILFCLESLESDRVLLYSERHCLLRVLPVLVVLATSGEKEGESFFKRIKLPRLIRVFRGDPVIPAFPDLHLAPASILKELAPYFQKVSAQVRQIGVPLPHELSPREASEYQREYLIVNHMGTIRSQHDEYSLRFAAALNQLQLVKMAKDADSAESTHVKQDMYLVVVEGFQLLSEWTGRIWEQSAWKFSRPAKDATPFDPERSNEVSDYEKVVRCNYTPLERKALVELISYIKGVGTMMERVDTLVADSIWEVLHAQVQEFVQNKLAIMLRTTFKKKKDLSRVLNDMRIIAADWMGNTSHLAGQASRLREEGVGVPVTFRTRPAAPTAGQLHCLQYLIHELVSGGSPKQSGGFFTGNDIDIPVGDMRQLENFFNRLAFFPHILDYRATLANLTDLGFLWFREFYLETSRVIQFPIECSLPWMLVEYVIESKEGGLLEGILMPFDVYNDAADRALRALKQRFLYDEIEAEVDLCFDQLVFKLSENMFGYYKSRAASEMLDLSFLAVVDNREKYKVFPKRYDSLFRIRRVKLLGRSIDLAFLIGQRMNKIFRENLDFLFERFEAHDLCSIVDLQRLVDILRLTHEFLSEHVRMDPFPLMMGEMTETISLVSFSGRIATQVYTELQNDFFPNFILCTATQRFVRSSVRNQRPVRRPANPQADPIFLCGTSDLNVAHGHMAELHNNFFGLPHMFALVKLLGSRSLPWLVRALLDNLSHKITAMEPGIEELRKSMPKAIAIPSHDWGVEGCLRNFSEQLQWASAYDGFTEMQQNLKEIGSLIFWMSLLDTAMRQIETVHFMQVVPWLGVVPNKEGQLQQLLADDNLSPLVSIFKQATDEVVASCENPNAFVSMAKQAQVADILYMNNLQTGSILDYTLAYLGAVLARNREKWDQPSKTGLIEITTSREYYRIYSGFQFHNLQGLSPGLQTALHDQNQPEGECFEERYGDAVAWGGCTIVYLLGQETRFELLDFSYHVLAVAESDTLPTSLAYIEMMAHGMTSYSIEVTSFLENARRARRLNSHVFSLLRARAPQEDKLASMIKANGILVHRVKYPVTPSVYATLPKL